MSTPCLLFADLEARVNALTAKFIVDQTVAELANPTSFVADIDRLAAFRLLVHAEIEEYLELKAREGIDTLVREAVTSGYKLRSLPQLFGIATILSKSFMLSPPFDQAGFIVQFNGLVKMAHDSINANNGVKAASFFLLSILSGKMADEVDQTLSASLTSYGKSRGDVAHKSVTRVRTLLAPSAEAKTASDIVAGLKAYFSAPNL